MVFEKKLKRLNELCWPPNLHLICAIFVQDNDQEDPEESDQAAGAKDGKMEENEDNDTKNDVVEEKAVRSHDDLHYY